MAVSIELVIDAALMGNSKDAAHFLEDEIERRGLQDAYIDALVPDYHSFEAMTQGELFTLLRATPAQRAQAYLKAVA